PVTQPLRNFSRQNYHETTQTPFQTLPLNYPIFQQAKEPTSALPSHDFGYNKSQPSHRNQKVPKDKDRNTIDTAELPRQRAATLRVAGDPRALTKLAAINGKKGMIPLAAKELLESTMVSLSLLDLAQFSPAFAQDTKSLISRKNRDRKLSRPKSSRKPIKIESDTLLASFDILVEDLKSSQAYVLQVNGPGLHGFDVRKVGAGQIDCINPHLVAARREDKAFRLPGYISYGKGNEDAGPLRHVDVWAIPNCYIICDQGSELNLITPALARLLNMPLFKIQDGICAGMGMRSANGSFNSLQNF
ncbi:hypothetical protein K3495_g16291, partial [Podosphaera aphanis]